jgi:hypothetical protein
MVFGSYITNFVCRFDRPSSGYGIEVAPVFSVLAKVSVMLWHLERNFIEFAQDVASFRKVCKDNDCSNP